MLSLVVYVPETHVEQVKTAVFEAGAGAYKGYDRCAWQVLGTGQFRPLEGSNPSIGRTGQVETVREWRVETICPEERIGAVLRALRLAHPYEEPAFLVLPQAPASPS